MTDVIQAIIFDFDNTLAESHIDFRNMKLAIVKAMHPYGFDFGSEEEIPAKFTAGDLIEQATRYDQENNTTLGECLWALVEDFEREGMIDIRIEDDVLMMLEALKANNIVLTILTNNAKGPTIEVLKRFKIDSFFRLVIAREDVNRMKPDKEGINLILEKLSLEPSRVVLVGDSWVDGTAANRANIRFILYQKGQVNKKIHSTAIWKQIQSMKDLVPIIINKEYPFV